VVGRLAGGALGATCVIMLYPRLPTASIVGSDIAHAVPLTLIAGIGHWFLGSIDWHLLGFLLAARCPGSCSAAVWPRGFRIPSCASVSQRH
jgi:uncharacterized membrane protein YfcA